MMELLLLYTKISEKLSRIRINRIRSFRDRAILGVEKAHSIFRCLSNKSEHYSFLSRSKTRSKWRLYYCSFYSYCCTVVVFVPGWKPQLQTRQKEIRGRKSSYTIYHSNFSSGHKNKFKNTVVILLMH